MNAFEIIFYPHEQILGGGMCRVLSKSSFNDSIFKGGYVMIHNKLKPVIGACEGRKSQYLIVHVIYLERYIKKDSEKKQIKVLGHLIWAESSLDTAV